MQKIDLTELNLHSNQHDQNTELAWGFPTNTLAYIKHFLSQRIKRHDHIIDKKQRQESAHAAKIYLRGINYNNHLIDSNKSYQAASITQYANIQQLIDQLITQDLTFIIDRNVYDIHFKNTNFNNQPFLFQASETNKSLEGCIELVKKVKSQKSSTICAIGGGITTDIAGFIASQLNLDLIFCPTTLLAQIDACIGGKNGVNFFPYGKNLVGNFKECNQLYICREFIETLPLADYYSGMGECFKHSLLMYDLSLTKHLAQCLQSEEVPQSAELNQLAQFKLNLVLEDPFNTGIRDILNLGHTYAHALETFCNEELKTTIPHGIAVFFGLIFSLKLSYKLKFISLEFYKNLLDLLPTKVYSKWLPSFDLTQLDLKNHKILDYMRRDKKNMSSTPSFIVLGEKAVVSKENNYIQSIDFDTLRLTLDEAFAT